MNEIMNNNRYAEVRQLFSTVPTHDFEKKVGSLRDNQLSPNTKLAGETYNTGDVTSVAADETELPLGVQIDTARASFRDGGERLAFKRGVIIPSAKGQSVAGGNV